MSAASLKQHALQSLRGKWRLVFGLTFATSAVLIVLFFVLDNILSFFFPGVNLTTNGQPVPKFIVGALLIMGIAIVAGPLTLGLNKFYLSIARGGQGEIEQLRTYFKNNDRLLVGWLSVVLPAIYTSFWTVLFVIPGIVKNLSYAMTPYILIDYPQYSVNEAITVSRQMMNGHKWRLFRLRLSFIGWAVLSVGTIFIGGIGFFWLIPYMQVTTAQFYCSISQ